MKIAVCDDEITSAEETAAVISTLLEKRAGYSITVCLSGEELVSKHETEKFDIIFLDIMLSGMNGMEAAKKIRSSDPAVIIAFLTNYQEFAAQGYEVGAFRYFVKNQPARFYEDKFLSVFDEYYINHKTFEMIGKNVRTYISLNDICFFEVHNKRITVHTADNIYEYSGTLSDVEAQISGENIFVRSHKSFLVNLSKIGSIGRSNITMKNGVVVMLSRSYKKEVIDRYVTFMTGR